MKKIPYTVRVENMPMPKEEEVSLQKRLQKIICTANPKKNHTEKEKDSSVIP